jgi:hypothetical protein
VLAGVKVTDQAVTDLAAAQGVSTPVMALAEVVVGTDGPRYIEPRHFTGEVRAGQHVELTFKEGRLSVRSLDAATYTLRREQRDREDVPVEQQGKPKRFPLAAGRSAWQLHLGALAGQHRLVTFDLVEGGQA